ncbi:MAG: thiamine-phosphate synthase family protein [Promethearchaeota archaeon]
MKRQNGLLKELNKFFDDLKYTTYMVLPLSKEQKTIITHIKEIYNFISDKKKFVNLIPEVRTNISGALDTAQKVEEIAGFDGRITVVNGFPKACGEVKFGASNHTARLVLTAKKFDNSINFVMNLKYIPRVIDSLQTKSSLDLIEFERETQPATVEKKEDSTMQWLIRKSFEKYKKIPDIIWDKGAIGKEPMMRLFAKTSENVVKKLKEIMEHV